MKQMHAAANQPADAHKAEQQTGADDDPNKHLLAISPNKAPRRVTRLAPANAPSAT